MLLGTTMPIFTAICLALTVNPGRVALWVVQPLILCVLYLVIRARHQRIRAAAIAEDRRRIAAALGVSEDGAKIHLKHVFAKLGVKDRTGAIATALRRGLVAP